MSTQISPIDKAIIVGRSMNNAIQITIGLGGDDGDVNFDSVEADARQLIQIELGLYEEFEAGSEGKKERTVGKESRRSGRSSGGSKRRGSNRKSSNRRSSSGGGGWGNPTDNQVKFYDDLLGRVLDLGAEPEDFDGFPMEIEDFEALEGKDEIQGAFDSLKELESDLKDG